MKILSMMVRALTAFALVQTMLLAPLAQAQTNSSQAAEAARKHRAEKNQAPPPKAAPARSSAATAPPPSSNQAYRSSANPNADPNASLKSCMDHSGMNPLARDRCMRKHCEGRWGQGDCPASGGDFMANKGASGTPLGQCLREAGANPFKRDACGWQHCRGKWDATAECAALRPRKSEEPGG
ncbi:hypothetical protein [Ottowia thiooxydans]|uniref:hypothetical protein n=1 Tax=Ottowia thiooxydans TaxID=219182 RepID=UPI00048DAC57|nr:hypothetical protein [Ottowia thiooxydans]